VFHGGGDGCRYTHSCFDCKGEHVKGPETQENAAMYNFFLPYPMPVLRLSALERESWRDCERTRMRQQRVRGCGTVVILLFPAVVTLLRRFMNFLAPRLCCCLARVNKSSCTVTLRRKPILSPLLTVTLLTLLTSIQLEQTDNLICVRIRLGMNWKKQRC